MINLVIEWGKKRLTFKKKYKDFSSEKQAGTFLRKILSGEELALAYAEIKDDHACGLEPTFILLNAKDGSVITNFKRYINPFGMPCIFSFWNKEDAARRNPYEVKLIS